MPLQCAHCDGRTLLSLEALHGQARVCLEAGYFFDPDGRVCVVAADTPVGLDLNKLFVGLLRRDLADGAFRVERLDAEPAGRPADA